MKRLERRTRLVRLGPRAGHLRARGRCLERSFGLHPPKLGCFHLSGVNVGERRGKGLFGSVCARFGRTKPLLQLSLRCAPRALGARLERLHGGELP